MGSARPLLFELSAWTLIKPLPDATALIYAENILKQVLESAKQI
jgi:hypothetical protein